MIVQFGGCRTARSADLGVAAEMIGQRGEADREEITITEPHADRAICCKGQIAELILPARVVVLRLPTAENRTGPVTPPSFLHVLAAAAIASEFSNNLVLVGLLTGPKHLLALRRKLGQPIARILELPRGLHTASRLPQGFHEQELFIAIPAVELQLCLLKSSLDLPYLCFELRQLRAPLRAALRLCNQPLLELQTDVSTCN